jgi:hypothetical protein
VQILFSGQEIISIFSHLQISNGIFHSLQTAAQSTKISIFLRVVFFQFSRDFFIQAAQIGSAPIISVSEFIKFLANI